MDKAQLILLRLPIFLFCSDLFNLFTPPPPKPQPHRPHLPHRQRPAVITSPSQYLRVFLLAITFAQVVSNNDITVETSDGDIVACIDKQKQPAFDHPLLKSHKIQESPSEIPRAIIINGQNKWRTSEAYVSIAKCPDGTIPIQNITALGHQARPDIRINSTFIPPHESDAYKTTGGYNLREPGFVQTNSEIVLGGAISPISSFGDTQFEITVLVWKDPKSGNWWLSLGAENSLVGYWPKEIFTTLGDHATKIDWGGEIVDSHSFGRHTKTQMGSGRFSEEGFGYASYFRNLEVVDDTNTLQQTQNLVIHEEGTYYNTKQLHTDEWGTHIFYGGPGFGFSTHSGVVPLRLSLFFIYFSFSFFIIF